MNSENLTFITPVTEALDQTGVPYKRFTHPVSVQSLEQAAQERSQRPEQVVRSIVFRCCDDEFIMVMIAGPHQISWPALRAYLGVSRISMATPEEILTHTGYLTGAVSPLGLATKMRLLVDESVLREKEISLGSGKRNSAIILSSTDLLQALSNFEIGNFCAC